MLGHDQHMSTLDSNVLRVSKRQVTLAYSYPKM